MFVKLRTLLVVIAVLVLCSCATSQRLILQETHTGGETGHGLMNLGSGWSGDMTIEVGNRTYNGTYVIVRGSQTSLGATNLAGNVAGSNIDLQGLGVSISTLSTANGTGILRSADGVAMKCAFLVGDRVVGNGVCGNSEGTLYDLQIIR